MAATPSTRTRHPKSVTRATILQKAYEMYLDRRLIHGDERLSVVLDELGYTTGAGYQIWANQAAFRDELQVYIAENISYASLRAIAAEIVLLHGQGLTFRQEALVGADTYINYFLGREDFYLSLRFYAMAHERPQQITEALITGYENLNQETVTLFETVMGNHSKKLVDGVTVNDMAVAATAMVEGYALRTRVQPDAIRADVPFEGGRHHSFSVAFLGMVEGFLQDA